MKKILQTPPFAASSLAVPGFAAEPACTTLTVSTDAAGPRIELTVYGHFVEHLGRGVYGGL